MEANKDKSAKEKKQIMEKLNSIPFAMNVEVFSHGQPWTYRNLQFWKNLAGQDQEVYNFLNDYLNQPSSKKIRLIDQVKNKLNSKK